MFDNQIIKTYFAVCDGVICVYRCTELEMQKYRNKYGAIYEERSMAEHRLKCPEKYDSWY